jgi:hypothetical protein
MMTATLSALLALSLARPIWPDQAPESYQILGPGVGTCGSWTEVRRAGGAPQQVASAWVLGYLTAYNEFVAADGNVAAGADPDRVLAWIDNYCRAHPLDNLALAARSLVDALKARKP